MYPRNAASPPRIAIGSVVQISDGAVQTSGCSVTVTPEGGSETAGGGTLACLATSGVWVYTPTQAETDYTAFVVAVYKASCLPACATIVTTASATSGRAILADDSITAGTFDESTAFPLKSADAGATLIFRTGADGDTGETISDQLDGCATPGAEMSLTSAIITALANAAAAATETEAINDATGGAFMQAIANKLASVFDITDLGLTAIGGAVVSALGTGSSLTALATATDLAAAQTVLDTIAGDVEHIDGAAMRGTDGAYTGTPPTADAIAAAVLTLANGIESGVTLQQALRAVAAVLAGKLSGGSTDTEVFKGIGTDTTRVTVTADESGNRSAVSLNL